MSGTTFVDTNVLVYARDSGQPRKQALAAAELRRLWQERTGRLSIQVLNEYYVTVTRRLKPGMAADAAWDDVTDLLSWAPQSMDAKLLAQARETERRYRTSWWDATIIAAAHLQGSSFLLSEDFQDGMVFFDRLTVRSPFTANVAEPALQYPPAASVAVPRHRKRGRPRAR